MVLLFRMKEDAGDTLQTGKIISNDLRKISLFCILAGIVCILFTGCGGTTQPPSTTFRIIRTIPHAVTCKRAATVSSTEGMHRAARDAGGGASGANFQWRENGIQER